MTETFPQSDDLGVDVGRLVGVDVGGTVRIDLGEIARGAERYHGKSTVAFTEMVAVDDIDSKDHGDPQLCAEYAAEIYHYMRQLEVCDWAGGAGYCLKRTPILGLALASFS